MSHHAPGGGDGFRGRPKSVCFPRALRSANRRSRTAEAVKAESEGSVQREPRTCPVCGTKFSADREFCPVCMLHRAFGAESSATGEPGSVSELAATTEEADRGSQLRRRAVEHTAG